MMNDRERVADLIGEAHRAMWGKTIHSKREGDLFIADHLINNGAFIPPCKVGDTVYVIRRPVNFKPYITEEKVVRIDALYTAYGMDFKLSGVSFAAYSKCIGVKVFFDREAAEKALNEVSSNAETTV